MVLNKHHTSSPQAKLFKIQLSSTLS